VIPSYEELRRYREARQKLYHTKEWGIIRENKLAEEPLCEFCKANGKIKLAAVVDHIIDIQDSPHLWNDPDNLRSLCVQCHNSKTAKTNNSTKSSGLSPQSLINLNPWESDS
jgi:5-methylcytosine-specific restriction protein A